MKVCVDIQSAMAQRAGVGRYTRSLVEALARTVAPGDTLRAFHFDFQRKGRPFPLPGAESRAVRWIPGRWVQACWKMVGMPPFNWFAGDADVYHFPNFIRPPLTRGRSVVTVHDVSFLRYPEAAEARNLRYLTAKIRGTVQRADRILTDCAFVADEVKSLLGVPAERLSCVYPGLSRDFAPAGPEAVSETHARLGLTRPYLLTVGTIEPRKNHRFLLEVFERMPEFDGDLVLAGMKGWKVEPILERIRTSPRADRIRVLDYVGESDLRALYTGAEMFLFPSLYEGFGFPPLEAMACDRPVLASTAGAIVEVLGDAAELLETREPEAWARAARRILSEGSAERAARLARGRERAKRYTWEAAAKQVWEIYREVAAG